MRKSSRGNKTRLALAGMLFFLMFGAIVVRAVQLQIVEGERLKRLGERQHLKEWIVLPKRGTIVDRNREPLALSLEAQSIYARPRRIENAEAVSRSLAKPLGLSPAEVRTKLKTEKPFVWIKRQVAPKEAEEVRSLHLEGVGMSYEPNRYYPQGRVAGQVIGFVGRDSQGLEGIEAHYDEYIRGETGAPVIERDALGRRVLTRGVEEVQVPPGADVELTLDTSIQHLAEKQLEATVAKFRAKAGIAVVVEPFTGEVLAMANYPFFNPNNYSRLSAQQWRNRAVADSFEPGSTFKTILAAAALEEGVVGKEDLFYCEFGKYSYGGRMIHDSHPYGWLPFSKIIQYSSNIGATKVAEKLKRERYFKYIERFGFGRPAGIDMPGEAAGLLRPVEGWSRIDLATHAFGQGIAVTPIQLAMAYGAIANGGFLMRPFVVRRVVSREEKLLVENQPYVVRRVISERTSRLLTSILKGVASDGGTGVMARIDGFEVAGKTGTAQKPDPVRGGYSAKKRVASFVGFVPADRPRMVLLVIVDEPELNVYGGVVAAPAFRNIASGVLRHLGVVPEQADRLPLPALKGETLARPWRRPGREAGEEQNGAGAPDFIGLSLREAVTKAQSLNIRVRVQGNGYVVRQSPAPGAGWAKREVVLDLQG